MTRVLGALRTRVIERAARRCEYCLLNEAYTIKRHEVDHVYAEKHDGQTIEENLCLSCIDCNRYKGSDLCSLDPETGDITALFHPRRDQWAQHFRLDGPRIVPLTPQARATVRMLHLNDRERLEERALLAAIQRYP